MESTGHSSTPDPAFEASLHAGGVEFGARDAELLWAVEAEGSLNAAASTLGRSYSRAHQRLGDLETAFGPLVERTRGGAGGGGSTLTDGAHTLLARYDRLRAAFTGVAETIETVLEGHVIERTGELGIIETDVGRVRAITPPNVEAVQVIIRADAVTLHEPGGSPAEDATSARNRFVGVISDIDHGETISLVTVDVGADESLFALVTEESRERLGLTDGTEVVASFKATATRATAQQMPDDVADRTTVSEVNDRD